MRMVESPAVVHCTDCLWQWKMLKPGILLKLCVISGCWRRGECISFISVSSVCVFGKAGELKKEPVCVFIDMPVLMEKIGH